MDDAELLMLTHQEVICGTALDSTVRRNHSNRSGDASNRG
jgi:hypothetical protein